jgi:hypothetical protein
VLDDGPADFSRERAVIRVCDRAQLGVDLRRDVRMNLNPSAALTSFCLHHGDRLPGRGRSVVNSDRQLSAPVEAQMQTYARRFRDRDADPEADRETLAAAEQTLRWVNGWLAELSPGPVDELVAVELTVKRDWALHAFINHGGPAWAKRKQLELTNGRALAICTGGRYPIYVKTDIGIGRAWPTGCFHVFPEATNIKGKKWPALCPDCQPRSGHRNPYRDGRRALERRAREIARIRTAGRNSR